MHLLKLFIKSRYNFMSFAVALIPSILLWVFQPTDIVPYRFFAISILLCVCLLWLTLMTYFHYCDIKGLQSLSVIGCMDGIILCRPTPNLGINVIVTLYETQNHYEQKLGYGYVQNIQQNGIIQIAVRRSLANEYNIAQLVDHINSSRSNIIIKTVATTDILNTFSEE